MATLNEVKTLGNIENVKPIENWAEASESEANFQNKESKLKRIEVIENDIKTVIEEIKDKENGLCQVISTYKVVNKKVPYDVAKRKKWQKFGDSENDGSGPNFTTTYVADEIQIQFLKNKTESDNIDENKLDQIKICASRGHCRFCKSDDHWSVACPYKSLYGDENDKEKSDELNEIVEITGKNSKYVPPGARFMSAEQRAAYSSTQNRHRERDDNTVRISNLPEEEWPDLEDELRKIFGQIGDIVRFYLSLDNNKRCKGFAFCSFKEPSFAEAAVQQLNGYKFAHLILKVDLAVTKNKSSF